MVVISKELHLVVDFSRAYKVDQQTREQTWRLRNRLREGRKGYLHEV